MTVQTLTIAEPTKYVYAGNKPLSVVNVGDVINIGGYACHMTKDHGVTSQPQTIVSRRLNMALTNDTRKMDFVRLCDGKTGALTAAVYETTEVLKERTWKSNPFRKSVV